MPSAHSSFHRHGVAASTNQRFIGSKESVLLCVMLLIAGLLQTTATSEPSSRELPGTDIDIQQLDREPPEVKKPYGLPEVDAPSKPETLNEIKQYENAIMSAQLGRMGHPEQYEPVNIDSLEELSAYARASNVYVKMKPGTYEVTRENYADLMQGRRRKDKFNVVHLLRFAGSNSLYDLSGVEITFSARIFPDTASPFDMHKPWCQLINVGGANQAISGLTFRIVDPDPPNVNYPAKGVGAMFIGGHQNMMHDVTIQTDGSRPYGYGDHLGKGSTKLPGVKVRKVNGLSHEGVGNVEIGTTVHGRSFGHVFTCGGEDMLIANGTFTGQPRLTTDILQETSGPAYENDFKNVWTDERIQPGYMLACTEQAFRTYENHISGKVLNCTVNGTRSGPSWAHAGADMFVSHMEVTRTTNDAYEIGPKTKLRACSADIRYSPALTLQRRSNVKAELDILPSPTDERVQRHRRGLWLEEYYDLNPKMAAWINNKNQKIKLTASEDLQLRKDDPHFIVIGQPSDEDFNNRPDPAVNVHLQNETGLPVLLAEESRKCTVKTNGKVIDKGEKNEIIDLK